MSRAVVAGVVVGAVAGVLFLAFFLYTGFCKKKKKGKDSFLPEATENHHGNSFGLMNRRVGIRGANFMLHNLKI